MLLLKFQYKIGENMKCKNCGHESTFIHTSYKITPGQVFLSNGDIIPRAFWGFEYIPCCGKCGKSFDDYIDFSTEDFLNLLKDNCDRKVKGKALIRYFHLDELLGSKKGVGD